MRGGSTAVLAGFRLDYAERVRVCAIIAVVFLHAAAVRVVWLPDIDSASWWTAHIVDSICRWAVPVFIMLSGALMLDPSRRDTAWHFYRKRASRVLVPLAFWAAFYFWWSAAFEGEHVDAAGVRRALWDGLGQNHLYFLFIIIGLYSVTPLMRVAMQRTPVAVHWLSATALFWLATSGVLSEHIVANAFTRFIPYLSYFAFGYLLGNQKLHWGTAVLSGLVFAAASGVIIVKTQQLVLQFGRQDYRAFAFYDHFSVWVLLQAASVFTVLQQPFRLFSRAWLTKWLEVVSPTVFGVYLVHFAFLDLLRRYTAPVADHVLFIAMVFEVAAALVLSAILTFGFLRIPIVRAIVGGG